MASQESVRCEKLRDSFEGREAIYVEKGALRVRVSHIRCNVGARRIDATVVEVPTPGLAGGLFHGPRRNEPLRWKIGAGFLTTFSDHTWQAGYGAWSLFFAPEIVADLANLAANWPIELDAWDRYDRAHRFLMDRDAYAPSERVFPD